MVTIKEGTYDVEFRCKRCGKNFIAGNSIQVKGGTLSPLSKQESDTIRKMPLVVHECSQGKYGFAEICGFTLDDR